MKDAELTRDMVAGTGDDRALDLSVVIGFRDWGQDRLLVAIRTIQEAMAGVDGEIIVSDYGSVDSDGLAEQVEDIGGTYVYTPTDGVWSRARALNAGFQVALGKVFISTDADMAFSPSSLARVCRLVQSNPGMAAVLQCRDLPAAYAAESFAEGPLDWGALEQASRLRPRWGMGGMIAVSRAIFAHVRGFDERMEIYGGEDLDFAERVRRAGYRIHWVEDPAVRMYHIWHEPSRAAADATPEGRSAIRTNRQIYLEDKSVLRNTRSWAHRPEGAVPPVTVVVATSNRADLLPDSINSVLAQTVQDFTLVIVDDGSTDNTRDVVASFDDPRITYVHQEGSGVAAARQRVAEMTRSRYTVIHDDDDLMLPWRLEAHLSALVTGVNGTYGGWVNFDDVTGELSPVLGKELSLASILFSSQVYTHGTVMLETELLRRLGYDATLRSGSDYNLGVRLVRSGAHMVHTGEFHIMRRLHAHQMTTVDPVVQKTSAVLSSFLARTPMRAADTKELRSKGSAATTVQVRGADNLEEHVRAYLPDHLVGRVAVVRVSDDSGSSEALLVSKNVVARIKGRDRAGARFEDVVVAGATWQDLARLTTAGLAVRSHEENSQVAQGIVRAGALTGILGEIREATGDDGAHTTLLVTSRPGGYASEEPSAKIAEELIDALGAKVTGTRVIEDGGDAVTVDAVTLPPDVDLVEAMEQLGSLPGCRGVSAAPGWTDAEFHTRLVSHQGKTKA